METLRSGTEWLVIDDISAAGSVRRAAVRLAAQLGFGEQRCAEAGIVASEIASNVFRHTRDGAVGVQVALREGRAGLQIVAWDRGPGMADVSLSSADGHSTSGTLGVGLGAISRLSSATDVSSEPGRGTVLVAELWDGEGSEPTGLDGAAGRIDVGGVTRPIADEHVCGDAIGARETNGRQVLVVCDGLGHGPLAAAASQQALRAFYDTPSTDPSAILARLHHELAGTRGAAIAIAEIDPTFRRLVFAGVGNVSAFITRPGHRRAIMSSPGIVGHHALKARQLEFDLDDEAVLVMHSDGVRDGWDLAQIPGLQRRSATVIATSVLRDGGTRPDDASVLVLRRRR